MRVVSPESWKVVKAETVRFVEGRVPPLCETVTLHRGRGLYHVRKVNVGTQEARPGPSVWSPMGAWREGEPKRRVELRLGVESTPYY